MFHYFADFISSSINSKFLKRNATLPLLINKLPISLCLLYLFYAPVVYVASTLFIQSITFLFQFVLAVILAAANADAVPAADADAVLPYAYAGHPGYAYAGHPGYAYAGHPGYAYAGHPGYAVAHAPVVAAPVQYALPPAREVVNAPVVEQVVEPVEQWGYSIRY